MNKQQYIEEFERFVHKRFKSKKDLEQYLQKHFNTTNKVKLEFASMQEKDFLHDYNLICLIENNEIFCDLDIYFLYDKHKYLYITEVGCEIDMKI